LNKKMDISIIVSMDKNKVIGKGSRIPWMLPADREYFKKVTMGHVVLMGRKTYESIGKPLDKRINVIMTRNVDYFPKGCIVVHSAEEVLVKFKNRKLFVIGGGEIYKQFLPFANRLYVTLIDHEFEGDTYFSEIDSRVWIEAYKKQGIRNKENPYNYYFIIYERKRIYKNYSFSIFISS